MPFNSAGVHSLPAGPRPVAGGTALASQVNTPNDDISSSLSMTVIRDGRAAMTGDLTLYRNAISDLHAVPKQQLDTAITALGNLKQSISEKNASNGYAGLKAPTINAASTGAKLTHGYAGGHIRIGTPSDAIDAFVGVYGDEYYDNVEQEARGVTYTIYNTRTTGHPDEPTLGWDFIAGSFTSVVSQYNQISNIIGTHKGVVGEVIAQNAASSYTVKKSYAFQATAIVGANAVLTEHYGLVVGTPLREENLSLAVPSSRIGIGYGIRVQTQVGSVDTAGIKLDGTGDAGRIKWTGTHITEDAGGKLELNVNSTQLVIKNPMVAASATAGVASALPGPPAGYLRTILGGSEFKFPYYNA